MLIDSPPLPSRENTCLLVLLMAAACSAYRPQPAKGKEFPDQEMLMPRTLPDEMYTSNFVWDNKGLPTRREVADRHYHDSAPLNNYNGHNNFLQSSLGNALNMINTLGKPQRNSQVHFPDNLPYTNFGNWNPRAKDDDIEQRMLLPDGMEIPDDMYGSNFKWERKGWPTLMGTAPQESKIVYFLSSVNSIFPKGSWFTAGLLLLLAGASVSVALSPNNFHRLLDLLVPEDEDLEASRRSVRAANPESFADYFRKLQLAQSELSKNASVGEAEIEKVFKSHGLETGNDTHDENGTTYSSSSTGYSSSSTEQYESKSTSGTTEFTTTITEKPRKVPCHAASGTCPDIAGVTITKTVKKQSARLETAPTLPTTTLTTAASTTEDYDANSTGTTTEPDSTFSPSSTTSYSSGGWWGVSRKSKPKHLKSTIARQVVNKIKTSRRRSHFD
ncbi:hypothetical protein C0J52_25483 [Blattella germanica]|nr:hypothetical protein C0J52_25483 [Blattella germanica]